jgi:hypothetical protein
MTAYIIAIGWGLISLVAIFHPRLGPQLYRTAWPGQYTDPHRKRLAVVQCVLLGIAWMLVGVIVLLQSFRNDFWTIVSLALLAVCAICVLAGLFMGSRLRRLP